MIYAVIAPSPPPTTSPRTTLNAAPATLFVTLTFPLREIALASCTLKISNKTHRIRGKKGKDGVGFTLKDINSTGNYYVYIWDKRTYDGDLVKAQREKKGVNYGRVDGWNSIGPLREPGTFDKLIKHLKKVYEVKEDDLLDIPFLRRELEVKKRELDAKQAKKFEQVMEQVDALATEKGVTYEMPATLRRAKKLLKQLKE